MILGIPRSRVFRIKIAIGHLDPKPVRIFIRGEMPKQFHMIIKQALIFISALDPMRNTDDIHRLNKVAWNPQRMRQWSRNLEAWEGNCRLLLLHKPEQWISSVISQSYYRVRFNNSNNNIQHNLKQAVQWVKGFTMVLSRTRKLERVLLLKLLRHMVAWTWTFKSMERNGDWYRSRTKSKFRPKGTPPSPRVD